MWAALATMVIGILGAVAQTDIRRILSFTLVSHIGYMVFGIALGTAAGLAGAIFYVAHHIAIQTTLFLVAGLIERQGGSTAVDRLGGLAKASPLLAVLFFVPGDEPGRHPAVLRVHRQAGAAAGRRRRRHRAGARAGRRRGAHQPADPARHRPRLDPRLLAPGRRSRRSDDTAAAAAADAGPDRVSAPAPRTTEPEPSRSRAAWRAAAPASSGARQVATGRHTAATDGLGGRGRRRRCAPLPRVMVGATAAMVAVTVALTGLAGPLYGITDRAAADDLLDRTPYIEAVFGGPAEVP